MEYHGKRVSVVTKADKERLLEARVLTNNKKATKQWLSVFFFQFRDQKVVSINMGTCSETEFARILEDVYCDLRNSKLGELYERASYLCLQLRAFLQRHIAELGRPFNIYSGQAFNRANWMLDGVVKENKQEGKEPQVQHKLPPLSDDDHRVADFLLMFWTMQILSSCPCLSGML